MLKRYVIVTDNFCDKHIIPLDKLSEYESYQESLESIHDCSCMEYEELLVAYQLFIYEFELIEGGLLTFTQPEYDGEPIK